MSEAYLADTHVLLWSIADDPRLNATHRAILASDAIVHASAASVWEIAIKKSLGKLDAPDDLPALLPRMRFRPLPVSIGHANAVSSLSHLHGDPFDRLLIAQARLEGLTLLTVDARLAAYDVRIV